MDEERIFTQAREAVEQGHPKRARDLLARLLKQNPNQPQYWLWMSAVVATQKEQEYCLRSVLRLDPQNHSAKQGLVLLGALPLESFWAHPGLLAGIAGVFILSVIAGGILMIRQIQHTRPKPAAVASTATRGPLPTFTPTPTYIVLNATTAAPGKGQNPSTPSLSATPATPPAAVYINTPHPINEAYQAGLKALQRGDWDTAARLLEQAHMIEPEAVDILYYLGEAFRLDQKARQALEAYEKAVKMDPGFAPAYLGRARARRMINPKTGVLADLEKAISLDPQFGEAYLERAALRMADQEYTLALQDMEAAESYCGGSLEVYSLRSQVYFESKDYPAALQAARQAYQLDPNSLSVQRLLGMAAAAAGEPNMAIQSLSSYTTAQPEDAEAWLALGKAHLEGGQPQAALEALDRAVTLDKESSVGFLYRGQAKLALIEAGEIPQQALQRAAQEAVNDFVEARRLDSRSFAANIGLGRALFSANRLEEAHSQFNSAEALAKTPPEMAELLYWRARTLAAQGKEQAAVPDWQALLDLPEEAFPAAWRDEARQSLSSASTPTATPTPTL